jgi:hypothetical protein
MTMPKRLAMPLDDLEKLGREKSAIQPIPGYMI